MEASPPPVVPVPVATAPVARGPKAYRRRVRQGGPLAGLLIPALVGVLSLLLLRNNTQAWRGIGGFLLAILAAPALLVAGAPLTSGHSYTLALLGSGALWMVLGMIAARIATRTPVATWRDYWREYFWLAGGVWIGVVVAVVAANLILGGLFL